ncbi:hypothetical protein UFOVP658_179 [uncultured Caudovirales phage]|uniref:Uncharacterized protein n=1 Tax=uncultured Caudovirales phage TaxID=2100421 RepID=A0A6J5NH50_9CAUD|nr:hypothetical protein UFOVP658_179 [uncultured Caudovirales phage]
MIAGIYNLFIEQGASFTRLIEIEYPDPDDLTVMIPYDMTSFSASMQIRRTIDSATPQITLTNSNSRIEIQPGGTENAIRLNLSAADTRLLTSDGVYDLEIADPSGNVQRILRGTVTLSLEVTR